MPNPFYKISEVIKILREEYPDISASALRYWDKLGIVSPSGKTEGGHRQYTDRDIDIICFVKECSLANQPIDKIKTDVEALRGKELSEGDKKTIILMQNMRKAITEFETTLNIQDSSIFEYVYSRESLIKILGQNADGIIGRAEEYKLIHPQNINGKKVFNKMDELIMREILKGGPYFIDKCEYLFSTILFTHKNFMVPGLLLSTAIHTFFKSISFAEKAGVSKEEYLTSVRIAIVFLLVHKYYTEFLEK